MLPWAPLSEQSGEWPTYHGHPSGNRHSLLSEISPSNIADLMPKWTFPISAASERALQVTPVVVGGVMYVTAPNEAVALDARTGRQLWRYTRPRTKGVIGDAGSGINRGVATLGDRVFMVTDHAHLIALDRLTGSCYGTPRWPTSASTTARRARRWSLAISWSPASRAATRIRGFLDAYRASTGERAWRFWTIPARGEPGSETWSGKALEHGCGATWLTGTYDPEARLLYWPTGNPCPDYNGDERKGDNLYTNSVVALIPQAERCSGTTSSRRTICTTGTRRKHRCSSTPRSAAGRESCSCRGTAMGSFTSSIGSRANC